MLSLKSTKWLKKIYNGWDITYNRDPVFSEEALSHSDIKDELETTGKGIFRNSEKNCRIVCTKSSGPGKIGEV